MLTEVRDALDSFRPSERRIAEVLITDPATFAESSVAEIAAEARTSTASVMRFTRRVGYEKFRDLRRELTEENTRSRIALSTSDSTSPDISEGDDLATVVAKVAASDALSIADTAATLDIEELEQAARAIGKARRIDAYGVGASALAALDLQRKLSGIGCLALEWPEPHAAWTAAALLDERAVAVGISHSGTTPDTVTFLKSAREAGATTIAVCNWGSSPLVQFADIVLQTAARETAFRSGALGSRIAQLMAVDCLFLSVAQQRPEESAAALRKTRAAVENGPGMAGAPIHADPDRPRGGGLPRVDQ